MFDSRPFSTVRIPCPRWALCVFQVAVGGGLVVKVLDRAEKEILARPAVCRHGCGIPITLGIQKVRALATVCVGN